MQQLALDAHARTSDPDTSHAAAASIERHGLRAAQLAVLACLRERGAMTDEMLAHHYEKMWRHRDWPQQRPSGLRTRRSELAAVGLVFDSEHRVKLASGRYGIVWAARQAVAA